MANEMEKLFQMGFIARIVISAGEARPLKYRDLGYEPKITIFTDGFYRGWYENIRNEDVIELRCIPPKISRFIMLEKI